MKKLIRSATNAQQAPISGWFGRGRQSARLAPSHTASITRNLTSGGAIQTISRMQSTVSEMSSGLENRFCRSQPTAPDVLIGGGIGETGLARTKAVASVIVAVSLMAQRSTMAMRRL